MSSSICSSLKNETAVLPIRLFIHCIFDKIEIRDVGLQFSANNFLPKVLVRVTLNCWE